MTTPAAPMDSTPAAPAKSVAVWEDLVDIFTSPLDVFRRRRDGRFWLALLVSTVLAGSALFAGRPVVREAFSRQMSAQAAKLTADPNIPAEQKEAIANQLRGAVDSPWAVPFGVLAVVVGTFFSALALWLLAKVFGSGATLGQSMAVTSLASIPRAVLGLVVAGVSVALGREAGTVYGVTASPAAFFGPESSAVAGALLSRLDLGILVQTVLMGLGIALMGRETRRGGEQVIEGQIAPAKGIAAAAGVWALAGLYVLWGATRV